MTVRIKEKSVLARCAAYRLKSKRAAMVIGKTIYLHNVSREDFLNNRKWLRHEVAHVKQYQQKGTIRFIFSYLMETFNMGYEFNRYEVEAKKKETDLHILKGVEFV
ncbi:MAG: DUF4157 domain-containing protein [Chitinophagaceae bacterium]|nr:DUF4157 domain-containing protein [Chitinophagaceae bacterium]MCW5905907.1 DUF4157 domain-containing protein [Chitinophagaceae bacterium]